MRAAADSPPARRAAHRKKLPRRGKLQSARALLSQVPSPQSSASQGQPSRHRQTDSPPYAPKDSARRNFKVPRAP
jgi:hypothetical protein